MCTVTYLPKPKGFVLTHNRDEAPSRSPQSLMRLKSPGGVPLLFPQDTLGGGTWIAGSSQGRTACILNGAFLLHKRELPYRKSRGLILLDFFDWKDPYPFFEKYDLHNIEPFTFLVFFQELPAMPSAQIIEFRWDGKQRHLRNLSPDQPHFWCSATLYPPDMQKKREKVFADWLILQSTNPPSQKDILQLHLKGSVGDPAYDFVMNRDGRVQTVSITQVVSDEKKAQMQYLDLLRGKQIKRQLSYREWRH